MNKTIRSILYWIVLSLIGISGIVFLWLSVDVFTLMLKNIGVVNEIQQYIYILLGSILIIVLIKVLFLKNISVKNAVLKILKI